MSTYRYFSKTFSSQGVAVSNAVKQLSKFASHEKLDEYSQKPIEYCYPNRMIHVCAQHHIKPIDLIKTASELREQLLVRLAHCLSHFRSIPFLPGSHPILLSLHERYLTIFQTLIKHPSINTVNDETTFFNLINDIFIQSNNVIGLLSAGCNEAQKHFKSYETMKDFLDNVLRMRLSMRLLIEHYIELHRQIIKNNQINSDYYGAIFMKFSPVQAVQKCISDVSAICFQTYAVVPHVQVENQIHESIPFYPQIVEYILREILKNSMRAVIEYNKSSLGNILSVKKYLEDNRDKPLCKVILSSNSIDEVFTIAIKDQGGGISATDEEIFRYMFTGDVTKADKTKKEHEDETNILADYQEHMVQSTRQMYGYGFGLPICRLYANFFAGSLSLQQVSRIGVDVFLRLGFIHTNSERIKI